MERRKINIIRYPGGKQRILNFLIPLLYPNALIKRRYIEPFLGSGALFFALNPKRSVLADINPDLIDLYRGIRRYPEAVWELYESFPKTKKGYYKVRAIRVDRTDLAFRAARILYLNRTCFKGMWRHNSNGEFNVGYGGQDRRWVIDLTMLKEVSGRLKRAVLRCSDFEEVIDESIKGDFIFADPPYKPGERELFNGHYMYGKFNYSDYIRLAEALKRASKRGVKWAVTISSHPDILNLFNGCYVYSIPRGTARNPGILINNPREVIIINYKEVPK